MEHLKDLVCFHICKNSDESVMEGYIDTTKGVSKTSDLANEIRLVNLYYRNWINQNVKKDFWNV